MNLRKSLDRYSIGGKAKRSVRSKRYLSDHQGSQLFTVRRINIRRSGHQP